jgi:hypothetical protein
MEAKKGELRAEFVDGAAEGDGSGVVRAETGQGGKQRLGKFIRTSMRRPPRVK